MAKERVEILTNVPGKIFWSCIANFLHSLVLLKKWYLLSLDIKYIKRRTGLYMMVHVIYCAHVICGHIGKIRPIEVSDSANQWYLDNFDDNNSIDEDFSGIPPPFRILKTTSRKRTHQKTTKRDPSGFEITERHCDKKMQSLPQTWSPPAPMSVSCLIEIV